VKKTDAAYFAGIIDGEGSIGIAHGLAMHRKGPKAARGG